MPERPSGQRLAFWTCGAWVAALWEVTNDVHGLSLECIYLIIWSRLYFWSNGRIGMYFRALGTYPRDAVVSRLSDGMTFTGLRNVFGFCLETTSHFYFLLRLDCLFGYLVLKSASTDLFGRNWIFCNCEWFGAASDVRSSLDILETLRAWLIRGSERRVTIMVGTTNGSERRVTFNFLSLTSTFGRFWIFWRFCKPRFGATSDDFGSERRVTITFGATYDIYCFRGFASMSDVQWRFPPEKSAAVGYSGDSSCRFVCWNDE